MWRLVSLIGRNRALIARAYLRIFLVDLRLRKAGLGDFLGPSAAGQMKPITGGDLGRAMQYAAWIALASRVHPVRARCLHRSLALHSWLQHDGLDSRLRIGVRKDGDALKAHAWVEMDGTVVNDTMAAIGPFVPLAGLESVGRSWGKSNQGGTVAWHWE